MKRAPLLLLPGLLLLLLEPAAWLWRTWWDPAWSSGGAWIAGLAVLLTARSVWSGPALGADRSVWPLLVLAASVRALGRLLSVNVIGAVALVIDVWAVARALRTDARPTAVSPAAISALFALSLPVEHIGQQLLSWPLRAGSSTLTAWLAAPFVGSIERQGTLLLVDGQLLEIDVPCSGVRGAVALAVLAAAIASEREVPLRGLVTGALAGAVLSNVARLWVIVVGPTTWLLTPGPHAAVGLMSLSLGALPLLALARRAAARRPVHATSGSALTPAGAALISALCAMAALAPHKPLDRSAAVQPVHLPTTLGFRLGQPRPHTPMEQAWVATWGGALAGRSFTDPDGTVHTAIALTTTAPVRHLHGADACLRGAGHTTERIAHLPSPVPTTVWRSTDPDGRSWRVATTFLSADGDVASTPSEVALRWLRSPGSSWTRLDRITPWEACEADGARCRAFDAELIAALDLLEAP